MKTKKKTKKKTNDPAPLDRLGPADAALLRAFQSNLLSLISHELRTPLMNILNALVVLESSDPSVASAFNPGELVAIARKNTDQLHRALGSLLDLASLESGTFHIRVREADLLRLVRSRAQAHVPALKIRAIDFKIAAQSGPDPVPVLMDPSRMGRAMDLCLEALIPRVQAGSDIRVEVTPYRLSFDFKLSLKSRTQWLKSMEDSKIYDARAFMFSGLLQPERAFLTRQEEGLGSEFLLVRQILKLHEGSFKCSATQIALELPQISSAKGLVLALGARVHQVSFEYGSVVVALIEVPAGTKVSKFSELIKQNLFRSTDTVYPLIKERRVGVLMDDCQAKDAPKLLKRMEKAIGKKLSFGLAVSPEDGMDPEALIELAGRRI